MMAKSRKPARGKKDKSTVLEGQKLFHAAIGVACYHGPAYPELFATLRDGGLDHDGAVKAVVRNWLEFFESVPDGKWDADALKVAIWYWEHFPKLYWFCGTESDGRPKADRELGLFLCYRRAQDEILAAAERAGLNCVSIDKSGRYCCNVIETDPGLGEFGGWPDCILEWDIEINPPEAVGQLREATDVLVRLKAQLHAGILPMPGEARGRGNHPCTPEETKTYAIGDLLKLIGVSASTLNRYAKSAGVQTPARGKRNHRYSEDDVRKILKFGAANAVDQKVKDAIKRAFDELGKR